ncbi:MAG: sugar phosphate isomerase/epimerase [Planctomycetes bacterium]|nr:sugar phosphate isomerase/epimerase [Planctomycetota bacterium]
MPYRLAGFADEISTDIQVQMDHLIENGVLFNALRGANNKNVMDFEDFQIPLTKTQFQNRGIKFSCIGSPLGKVKITDPFEKEMDRLKIACKRAKQFETKVIRIFSFYLPEGDDPANHKDEVIRRIKAMADYAKTEGLNLIHENEAGIFGNTADRCVQIFEGVNAPNLMAAFDFANFAHEGEDPLAAWPKLKKWVKDFHIKDWSKDAKQTVPAGKGDGKMREILKDAFANNWAGMLTLEPHLTNTDGFKELNGGQRFKAAAEALKGILAEVGAK